MEELMSTQLVEMSVAELEITVGGDCGDGGCSADGDAGACGPGFGDGGVATALNGLSSAAISAVLGLGLGPIGGLVAASIAGLMGVSAANSGGNAGLGGSFDAAAP